MLYNAQDRYNIVYTFVTIVTPNPHIHTHLLLQWKIAIWRWIIFILNDNVFHIPNFTAKIHKRWLLHVFQSQMEWQAMWHWWHTCSYISNLPVYSSSLNHFIKTSLFAASCVNTLMNVIRFELYNINHWKLWLYIRTCGAPGRAQYTVPMTICSPTVVWT